MGIYDAWATFAAIAGGMLVAAVVIVLFERYVCTLHSKKAKAKAYEQLEIPELPALDQPTANQQDQMSAISVEASTSGSSAPKTPVPPHELESILALEDRIALARFAVTMCGYGPYGASLKLLKDIFPPRMMQLRAEVTKTARRLAALEDLRQLDPQDAERLFEEMAHDATFLETCKVCAKMLENLVNVRYRRMADMLKDESHVISPAMLPSPGALKLLLDS